MLQLVCQLRDKLRGQKLVIDTNTRKIAKAKTISQNTHQRCLYFFFLRIKKSEKQIPCTRLCIQNQERKTAKLWNHPRFERERERERGLAGACDYSYETSLFLGAKLPHNSPR